eukprot:4517357-Pleurochrysis_carterae.AAC.1
MSGCDRAVTAFGTGKEKQAPFTHMLTESWRRYARVVPERALSRVCASGRSCVREAGASLAACVTQTTLPPTTCSCGKFSLINLTMPSWYVESPCARDGA